ncbi:MAG: dNTP triphosphohydrolase [Firmicutes bacterium]|nr:dNTP triphosphohydrolase [Bacillota bacterium]
MDGNNNLVIRTELLLKREKELADYSQRSFGESIKRLREEKGEDKFRTPFQRDRDRIVHSRAFRRLMHKTQVFTSTKGDHYRTRLTHTMEVMQIARSLARNLGLNEELTEAIALGHDLGHTPFGHVGERTLHDILSGHTPFPGSDIKPFNYVGGFKHNFQSLHVVDNLEQVYEEYSGLNLTFAVREGIFKHTNSKISVYRKNQKGKVDRKKEKVYYANLNLSKMTLDKPSFSLEGQAVAVADEIAQRTHDLEDGFRAKFIDVNDLVNEPLVNTVIKEFDIDVKGKNPAQLRSTLIRKLIQKLVTDVLEQTNINLTAIKEIHKGKYPEHFEDIIIWFSETIDTQQESLQRYITDSVVSSLEVSRMDCKAEKLIQQLFWSYFQGPQQLPDNILEKHYIPQKGYFKRKDIAEEITILQNDPKFIRLICDHISGMTDQYAFQEYNSLFLPNNK